VVKATPTTGIDGVGTPHLTTNRAIWLDGERFGARKISCWRGISKKIRSFVMLIGPSWSRMRAVFQISGRAARWQF